MKKGLLPIDEKEFDYMKLTCVGDFQWEIEFFPPIPQRNPDALSKIFKIGSYLIEQRKQDCYYLYLAGADKNVNLNVFEDGYAPMLAQATEDLGRTPTYADIQSYLTGEDSDPPSGALATLVASAFIAEVRRNWLVMPVNYFFLDLIAINDPDYTMTAFLGGGAESLHSMAHSAPPPFKQVFGNSGDETRDPLLRMYGGRPATTVFKRETGVFGAWLSRLAVVDDGSESEIAGTIEKTERVAKGSCPRDSTAGVLDIVIELGNGRLKGDFARSF